MLSVERLSTLPPEWDARVARLPGATLFHSAAWTRVLAETYDYRPCHLAVASAGGYAGVLPLMEVASPLTGRRGVALPFTDLCAPLGDAATREALLAEACAVARERRWKYLEVRADPSDPARTPRSTAFYHHTLALEADEDRLLAGLDASTRRAVRKAREGGLTMERGADLAAMRAFYDLLTLTRRRHGVPPQPFGFFAAVQRHLLAEGHGDLFLARQAGRPVAGVVCLRFGCHVVYKFGASDERFQQLRANNLVMWEAIRHYAATGHAVFDFGRTSLDNEGLRRFKRGWGAVEAMIGYLRVDPATGRPLTAPDQAAGWHNAFFRALPPFAARALGAVLYRHMG